MFQTNNEVILLPLKSWQSTIISENFVCLNKQNENVHESASSYRGEICHCQFLQILTTHSFDVDSLRIKNLIWVESDVRTTATTK